MTYRIEVRPEWALQQRNDELGLQGLIDLLSAIASEGNLSRACVRLGVSYRHGWAVLRQGATSLGAALVTSRRGQQCKLTPLGEKLVWANKRALERLAPVMKSAASELESEIRRSLAGSQETLRVQAGYAIALVELLAMLQKKRASHHVRYVGAAAALSALACGDCDVAGFAVPLGELEAEIMRGHARWLDRREHVLVHLVVRHQGLIVAPGNPLLIGSVADLARPGVRFVNRQPGSGTRTLIELLLGRAGVGRASIAGFDLSENTHGAVAAYVASGLADAGPGVETAARRFGLGFVPLANERYLLACRREALHAGPGHDLLETIRSAEFRLRLSEIPGIDLLDCGKVQRAGEAFALASAGKP